MPLPPQNSIALEAVSLSPGIKPMLENRLFAGGDLLQHSTACVAPGREPLHLSIFNPVHRDHLERRVREEDLIGREQKLRLQPALEGLDPEMAWRPAGWTGG